MGKILSTAMAIPLIASATVAEARGGWYGHDHHWGGGHSYRPRIEVEIGIPLGWPRVGYYRPYVYAVPYGYPAPVTQVVVERQPQVYVQQQSTPAAATNATGYWYYCPDSKAYYPYAQTCPSPWLQVVPQTTPQEVR